MESGSCRLERGGSLNYEEEMEFGAYPLGLHRLQVLFLLPRLECNGAISAHINRWGFTVLARLVSNSLLRVLGCRPSCNEVAQSLLTAALNPQAQVTLPPQPPNWDHRQAPLCLLTVVHFVEKGFNMLPLADLELLGSSDLPTSAFQSTRITGMKHHTWPAAILSIKELIDFTSVLGLRLALIAQAGMAGSWFTVTSTFQVEAILLSQPPKVFLLPQGLRKTLSKDTLRQGLTTLPRLVSNSWLPVIHPTRHPKCWDYRPEPLHPTIGLCRDGVSLLLPRLKSSDVTSAHYNLCLPGSKKAESLSVAQAGVQWHDIAHCSLKLLGSSSPLASASQRQGHRMLPRLFSNSWAQAIHPPQLPIVQRLQGVTLSPRLEYSGMITVHCSINPPGSGDPLTSASWIAGTTGILLLRKFPRNPLMLFVMLNMIFHCQTRYRRIHEKKIGENGDKEMSRDHNYSPAREQGWMENEFDELTETGFRRWVIRNFAELKEHVLTQCKETKNLEKRFDEMLTRINSLEKNINELMELKNTTRELCEAYTTFHSRIDQAEEKISEIEDQLNEIK
ncbi:LOW QUALITY PROTEIN: LINE-1 retrotransposable element ORF1 protein [Plecturocebus cupreus]